ncbi:hypothetical protein BH11PLA2_BH11PLA2_06520 [soil metagenome]
MFPATIPGTPCENAMSIAVQCPECNSRLNAPDAAAGKRVKCPKCATVMQIPAVDDGFEVVDEGNGFEVVDEAPAKPKAKPAPKRRLMDEDDDDDRPRRKRKVVDEYDDDDDEEDDEDEDDRPRKIKAKKKATGSSKLPLITSGAIAAVLLLGVGGYFLFSGSKGGTSSVTGVNWTKFDASDGSYTAYFPNGAPTAASFDELGGEKAKTPQEAEQAKQFMEAMGMKFDAWKKTDSGRDYLVFTITLPAAMASQMKKEDLTKPMPKGGRGGVGEMAGMKDGEILNDETTTVSGQTAKQVLVKDKTGKYMFMRIFFVGEKVVMLGVKSSSEMKPDDAAAKEFFNKFEWKAR